MNRTKIKCNRLIVNAISLPYNESFERAFSIAKHKISKTCGISGNDMMCSIFRRSVDARRKDDIRFVYTVLVEFNEAVWVDKELLLREDIRIDSYEDIVYEFGSQKSEYRPIIVGCGPAGMFCALMLAERGYNPILIERGQCLDARVRSVETFFNSGILDTESNVMFGAGGAGTFSDGKLVTRINDPLCRYVIERKLDFGAPDEIRYMAKPHIGTDLLKNVVQNLLNDVINRGGEIIYNCRFDSFTENSDGSVTAHTSCGDIIGSCIVLAIGHSARDTYSYLNKVGVSMIAKPFSVGVRIEHLRTDIEFGLYGKYAGDPILGAAEYALSDTKSGRGVYTFCMCPGGEVIAAASEEGGVVVNGMSQHSRSGVNSNSAVAVSIRPQDYDGTPMGAVEFQRKLERRAFSLGGGNYSAPVETLGDFLSNRKTNLRMPTKVQPSYTRSMVTVADISSVFPEYINDELRRGFASFGKKLPGFDSEVAVMTAVESRTSSPIRILRDDMGCAIDHNLIYPCGEGAGYAGGITSAAVDGIKTALAIMKRFAP